MSNYETTSGSRSGATPEPTDEAYRSHQKWKKTRSKPSRTADGRCVSTITFDDPDWWRCQLALRRERLAKLAGA
jgi:hypothetical protein